MKTISVELVGSVGDKTEKGDIILPVIRRGSESRDYSFNFNNFFEKFFW